MPVNVVYRTDDGKEFATFEQAQAHDLKIETLRKEIKEDISKILIKLKDLKSPEVGKVDDEEYGSYASYEIKNLSELQDEYLCNLKKVLQVVSASEYDTREFLLDYYNSSKNC